MAVVVVVVDADCGGTTCNPQTQTPLPPKEAVCANHLVFLIVSISANNCSSDKIISAQVIAISPKTLCTEFNWSRTSACGPDSFYSGQ
jgi:hypothetical protein